MRPPIHLLFALSAACAPSSLAVAVPWLELDLEVLEILDADPQEPTLASFHVYNTGTGEATVRVHTEPPLVALTQRVDVPAGGSAPITVQFRPVDLEPVNGLIELSTGYDVLELPVHVTVSAEPVPAVYGIGRQRVSWGVDGSGTIIE